MTRALVECGKDLSFAFATEIMKELVSATNEEVDCASDFSCLGT